MRVTQSMLSSNMLRNLSASYSKMGNLQDQLLTRKKVNRPSDDPVAALKGVGFRTDLGKIEQFKKNIDNANSWLDSTDTALDAVGKQLHRVNELVIDAANDTKTHEERLLIKIEIDQIRGELQSIANTQVGGKYIFNGTNTLTPVYQNGTFSMASGKNEAMNVEVFDGIEMKINITGIPKTGEPNTIVSIFENFDMMMDDISTALGDPASGGTEISSLLGDIAISLDTTLSQRAEVGARQNRADMMTHRLDLQGLSTTKVMSENEDVDYEKAISDLVLAETLHRAALSVGARIIQPSLVDFLR